MPFDPHAFTSGQCHDPRGQASEHGPEQVYAMETPIGRLALHWQGGAAAARAPVAGALIRIVLAAELTGDAAAAKPPPWLAGPLLAYFQSPVRPIDLPVQLAGTPFQRRVWDLIAAIPPGATRSYGALAAELRTSARAVGGACRANPCPLVVPCHRVVARHGLGGFAGDRNGRLLGIKRWLLAHEAAVVPA